MIDEKKLIKEMERWATSNFSVLDDKYEYRLEGMIKAQDIVLAQPQVGGWIPVTVRLPEKTGNYLVTRKGYTWIANWFNWTWWGTERKYRWTGIEAWQPLPEPYKESEEE